MSDASVAAAGARAREDAADARWERLPAPLRPRSREQPGSGQLRLVETTLLVLVGLVLALATVNDLVRQTHINQRLVVDLRTWRHYTRHDYHGISIDQETLGVGLDREVLCGNVRGGPPDAETQLCLAIWGPTHDGLREVHGGWYLPPYVDDIPAQRYGCFGEAGRGKCQR